MKWKKRSKLITVFILGVALWSGASLAEMAADNTKENKRDMSTNELTADQQAMRAPDTEITRRIRADLMKDQSLSTYAHNIKIITVNGQVTIKGPVRSQLEVENVLKYARSVAGDSNVINKITVVSK